MHSFQVSDPGRLWPAVVLASMVWLLLAGCGHAPIPPAPSPPDHDIRPWSPDSYRAFLTYNRQAMDRIYGNDYVEVRFVVDTAQGALVVQRLIDPDAVRHLVDALLPPQATDRQILDAAYDYVMCATRYEADPSVWPTIGDTLTSGRADCKGRSLLLLSLLLAARINAYAAIGNGHMWVVAMVDGDWQPVETDTDPQRSPIYRMPGFYDRPLYRIDARRTLKRRRTDRP